MRLALPRHELRLGLSSDRPLVRRRARARRRVPAPLSRLSGSVSCHKKFWKFCIATALSGIPVRTPDGPST